MKTYKPPKPKYLKQGEFISWKKLTFAQKLRIIIISIVVLVGLIFFLTYLFPLATGEDWFKSAWECGSRLPIGEC